MPIIWRQDDRTSFSTQTHAETGERYFLRVERLPDKGWDWLVWRADGPRAGVRYGYAASAKAGKAAAEHILATLLPGPYAPAAPHPAPPRGPCRWKDGLHRPPQ